MPSCSGACGGCFGYDRVRETRPGLFRPVAEASIAQAGAREARDGVDPKKASALAEVAESARRVAVTRPVRLLRVAELEAETPVVRLHAAIARQNADEAGEGHRRRFG